MFLEMVRGLKRPSLVCDFCLACLIGTPTVFPLQAGSFPDPLHSLLHFLAANSASHMLPLVPNVVVKLVKSVKLISYVAVTPFTHYNNC